MKRRLLYTLFAVVLVAVCLMLTTSSLKIPISTAANLVPVVSASTESLPASTPLFGTAEILPYLMDVQIGSGDAYLSKTSGSVGSYTTVGSCITYQGGSGESYGAYYYELPSGGGSTLRWSDQITGPWTGCWCAAMPCAPVFSVSANSKVRVDIVSNSGVTSVHQVDVW